VNRAIDNVRIERFWRSVKYENIFLSDYSSVVDARTGIGKFIDYYNTSRSHQALDFNTPYYSYFGYDAPHSIEWDDTEDLIASFARETLRILMEISARRLPMSAMTDLPGISLDMLDGMSYQSIYFFSKMLICAMVNEKNAMAPSE
jgi:putative transposase